jgi:hypothetical protein
MIKKGVYPVEDMRRLAERVANNSPFEIKSRDDLEKGFELMSGHLTNNQKYILMPKLQRYFSFDKSEKKEAEIVDKQKRKKVSQIGRKTDKAYIQVETQGVMKTTRRGDRGQFMTFPSIIKGKIVYASKETIKVRGKGVVRFRDRRGRFASNRKQG